MAHLLGSGRKPGRPAGTARAYRIGVQLSREEVDLIERAAASEGVPTAVFCRAAALRAARQAAATEGR